VLEIHVVNNTWFFVRGVVSCEDGQTLSNCILGHDGYVYWPPAGATHTMKFDPEIQALSLHVCTWE
jgi:hypothetical protein